MSFKTQKNKVSQITQESVKNEINIERQEVQNQQIDTNLQLQNLTSQSISQLHDFSQDWQVMQTVNAEFDPITRTWIEDPSWGTQVYQTDISLGKFDIQLLPYINVSFLFKPTDYSEINKVVRPVNYFFCQIDELSPEEEFIKIVTLKCAASIFGIRYWGVLTHPWMVKILIKFSNPQKFL